MNVSPCVGTNDMYEHVPHPVELPAVLEATRRLLALNIWIKVDPVHAAPGTPHVPMDSVAPAGTVMLTR